MQKRAQLSVFLVVGIIIIAAVGFLVFIKQPQKEEEIPASMAHIKIFVEQCVKQTAEDAALVAGVQGGYIYLDNVDTFESFYSDVAYWYRNGVQTIPSQKTVELEIARYLVEEINLRCLQNFRVFQGEDIRMGQIKADVSIGPETMLVDMTIPLDVTVKDQVTKISDFSAEIDVSLGKALVTGKKIVEMEAKDPEWVNMDYIASLDFDIAQFNYGDVAIYSIIDEEKEIAGMPFRLIFANDFSTGGEETEEAGTAE